MDNEIDVAKKRKKVAFVSAYHQEFSLHSDEESDKEYTVVTVKLMIYIRKTAAGQELDLNRTFARFGSKKLREKIMESDKLQDLWAERRASRGFKSNLDGLMEFSCRMETTKGGA